MNKPEHFSTCVAEYDPNALPVGAAREIVRQWALPRGRAPVQRVSLFDALDRVLAADVTSPINVPSHDNSAMDGYAFSSAALSNRDADGSVTLDVVGTAFAGKPFTRDVDRSQCVRIMTGALIPPGATPSCGRKPSMRPIILRGFQYRTSSPARTGGSLAKT